MTPRGFQTASIIVFVLLSGVLGFWLVVVVPVFARTYLEFGVELPPATSAAIRLSELVKAWLPAFIPALIAVVALGSVAIARLPQKMLYLLPPAIAFFALLALVVAVSLPNF